MFLTLRDARKLALLSATAVAAIGTVAAPAQALQAHALVNYQCDFPFIETQPVSTIQLVDLPESIAAGTATGPIQAGVRIAMEGNAAVLFQVIGADSVSGSAKLALGITAPGLSASPLGSLPIESKPVPQGPGESVVVTASGKIPSVTFPQPGTATVSTKSFGATLTASNADGPIEIDGSNSFDVPCTVAAGQNTSLGTIAVTPAAARPTISLIDPNSVPARRTSYVVVTGTNLDRTKAVKVGGQAATFINFSKTYLVIALPPLAAGKYPVSVTTATGTTAASAAATVTYTK